jgi:hypothetical protein
MNLQELFKDHQLYHSEFQQDYLITVRSGGTQYGMYKQALRELYKRYRGLKQLYGEKELLQVDIDELAVSTSDNVFEQRRNDIKHAQKIMAMEEMDKNIADTEREFKRFYQQACTLKAQIGELTEEKRNQLDREMWEFKLKEMAAVDWTTTGRLSNNTVEFLMSLPDNMRKPMLNTIKDVPTLIDWYETRQADILLPEKEVDIKQLMGDL